MSSSPAIRGIILMVASTVCFSTMHAAISFISSELHPFQIAFFRNFFGLLIFLPVVFRSGLGFLRTDRLGMHILRALLNVGAMLAFFSALAMTPIARVTALAFTAPLFMAILSVMFLNERLDATRIGATVLGFLGTAIVLRLDLVAIDIGAILVIGSAATWAVTMIVIKKLARTESSLTITGYMSILLSVLSFVPALLTWTWPSAFAWVMLVFIGVSGTIAQLALAESLKQADATAVMPFDFLKLVWAALLGYMLFAQAPDGSTWIGGALIFGAGIFVLYKERTPAKK
ncbi:MAG: DMT family transporter [Pseudomonadota bacterium]